MTRHHRISLSLFVTALLLAADSHPLQAQQAAGDWEVRVYRVADLVVPRPDYPFRGNEIPTTGSNLGTASPVLDGGLNGSGFGGGGFGGGGIGGGGGGGFFQVGDSGLLGGGGGFSTGSGLFGGEPAESTSTGFTTEDLIAAIQSTIQPESWDVQGGDGVCTSLGGMLIVKQTPPAHEEIEALLIAIRGEGGAAQTVSVHAWWVAANADEIAALTSEMGNGAPATIVNREALLHLMATATGHEGRITCYSGQTVHFAAGTRRSAIVSAVPVVSATTVGYQPVTALPNIGVLLEVQPTLIDERAEAVLNLVSTVTSMQDAGETIPLSFPTPAAEPNAAGGVAAIQLDRLNLDTQHIATTVRVPLGQPVLVGGMSRTGEDDGAQLYLIVEVTAHAGP